MTNNEAGTPLWTTEYMIARAEGIAAHWHRQLDGNQVFELSRDILRFVEGARAADAQTIATLRAQVAEALEQNEQLSKMVSMEFEQSMNKGQRRTQPGGEGDNA